MAEQPYSGPVIGLLRQMQRLLRPGGLVYIRVPNLDAWYRRVLGRNWWGFSVEHVGHFTGDSISRALAAASLDVLAVRSADSDPQSSMWPIAPLLLGAGLSCVRSAPLSSRPLATPPRVNPGLTRQRAWPSRDGLSALTLATGEPPPSHWFR